MPGRKSSSPGRIGPFTLEELELVGAPPDNAFEALTRLAARLFKAPVALISIIEEEKGRQFFKSQHGLSEPWASQRYTPLSHSFCQYVKRDAKALAVRSASDDPLVRNNLAIRDLDIVSYLGVPIFAPNGDALGALCVVDSVARDWSANDISLLSDVGACVSEEILLRASVMARDSIRKRLGAGAEHGAEAPPETPESVEKAFMDLGVPLDERFGDLLRHGCEALGMRMGAVAKVDGETTEFLFRHAGGISHAERLNATLSGSLGALVLSRRERIEIENTRDSAEKALHNLFAERPGSYIGAPLLLDGKLIGVIEFSSMEPRKSAWTNEQRATLDLVAMLACAHLGLFS